MNADAALIDLSDIQKGQFVWLADLSPEAEDVAPKRRFVEHRHGKVIVADIYSLNLEEMIEEEFVFRTHDEAIQYYFRWELENAIRKLKEVYDLCCIHMNPQEQQALGIFEKRISK